MTIRCHHCRRDIDDFADAVCVGGARYACMRCAMARQAKDDERRWERSRELGETPAEKCLREAREWQEKHK